MRREISCSLERSDAAADGDYSVVCWRDDLLRLDGSLTLPQLDLLLPNSVPVVHDEGVEDERNWESQDEDTKKGSEATDNLQIHGLSRSLHTVCF